MDSMFVDILKKLMAEQGREALLNAPKCKAFLADYTHGEYKKESRVLLQVLGIGVQKAIDSTEELAICKKQQIRILREEYFLAEEVATDVVDTLALVLRGEAKEEKKKVCKKCGKELQEEWNICPYCGTSVVERQETPVVTASNKNQPRQSSQSTQSSADASIKFPPGSVDRGEAYRMQGQYDNAFRDYNEAIRLNQNDAWAYCCRGEAYRQQGQYDNAIRDFNEAIRLAPNYSWAYGCRGEAYRQQGKYGSAFRDFDEAVRLDPAYSFINGRLSWRSLPVEKPK